MTVRIIYRLLYIIILTDVYNLKKNEWVDSKFET